MLNSRGCQLLGQVVAQIIGVPASQVLFAHAEHERTRLRRWGADQAPSTVGKATQSVVVMRPTK